MQSDFDTLITDEIVDKAVQAFNHGSFSSNAETAIRESVWAALRAVEADIIEAFGVNSGYWKQWGK